MKRVLVTGGTGFIGRHALQPLVVRGYEVHVCVRGGDRAAALPPGVSPEVCDLFDERARRQVLAAVRPTHLLHFAWYTAHGKFWTAEENLAWTQASLGLLRDFADCGGGRAVSAGTCAEYDWSQGACCERATPLAPRTLYGTCKNSLRQIWEKFSETRGLSTAWGRIFFLYGPDEHSARFVPAIIQALRAGRLAQCRCGGHVRDFLHAADVAEAFVALLDSPVSGPINIASGRPISLGAVATLLGDRLGGRQLLELGEQPGTPDNPVTLTALTARLRDEVGWRPRYTLEQGLDSLLATADPRRIAFAA